MVPSDVKNLMFLKLLSLLLKSGYQKTAPVDSANGISTKLAFYEFLAYFVFILVIFPVSHFLCK